MNDWVFTLAMNGNGNLYAGGNFTTAGDISANRIAKWNGSSGSALSSGMGGEVYNLAFDGSGNLYAGGNFLIAGDKVSSRFARYSLDQPPTVAASALPAEFQLAQNSPNPFNPTTTIQFSVPRESYVRLKVYNAFGAEVASLVDQQVAAGSYKITWNASHLASGIYMYRLEAESFAQTKRLLLMK